MSGNSPPLSGGKGCSHPVGKKQEVDHWITGQKTADITVYFNEKVPRAHQDSTQRDL